MMTMTLPRRARVAAAVDHAPTGVLVVEDWHDRARSAVDLWRKLLSAGADDEAVQLECAWDLLACRGGLERLSCAVGDGLTTRRLRMEVLGICAHSSDELLAMARDFPDPAAWIEAARAWSEECDDPAIPEEEAAQAGRELLSELDDAQLVAWSLDQLRDGAGAALDDALLPCATFATGDPAMFFRSAPYLLEAEASFDLELAAREPELDVTTLKFGSILDALASVVPAVSGEVVPLLRPFEFGVAAGGTDRKAADPLADSEHVFEDIHRRVRIRLGEVARAPGSGAWVPVRREFPRDSTSFLGVSLTGLRRRESGLPPVALGTLAVFDEGQPIDARVIISKKSHVVALVPWRRGSRLTIVMDSPPVCIDVAIEGAEPS
jgi:hypothetical protein